MSNDRCNLPSPAPENEESAIQRMLSAGRIAIVGLSDDPHRPSYGVASYLKSVGYVIVPVNPNHSVVLGMKSYSSLREVPGEIDLVDVFRRPEHCEQVTREAIEKGAKGVWLQSGVTCSKSKRLAREAGIDFVQDRCLKVDHMMRN